MLRNRVSEFIYMPVKDKVEGLSVNKSDWNKLFKISFFKKNYFRSWCENYVENIKRPVEEHRSLTSEKFKNRVDYVELSAFGVDFKQKKNEINILDNRAIKKMLKRSKGIGKLALDL
jgi:hypothetical protein